jgi:hypothetical protein
LARLQRRVAALVRHHHMHHAAGAGASRAAQPRKQPQRTHSRRAVVLGGLVRPRHRVLPQDTLAALL